MTEEKVNNKFIERKNDLIKSTNELYSRQYGGNNIRNLILSTRGDALPNEELYNHYYEYRRKRLACLFSFTAIPIATWLYTKQPKYVLLSLLPAYLFDKGLCKLLTGQSTSSYQFGFHSYQHFYKVIYCLNNLKLVEPADKWHNGKRDYKEFIERNTYR
jgi:hypothetical protein